MVNCRQGTRHLVRHVHPGHHRLVSNLEQTGIQFQNPSRFQRPMRLLLGDSKIQVVASNKGLPLQRASKGDGVVSMDAINGELHRNIIVYEFDRGNVNASEGNLNELLAQLPGKGPRKFNWPPGDAEAIETQLPNNLCPEFHSWSDHKAIPWRVLWHHAVLDKRCSSVKGQLGKYTSDSCPG